MERRFAWMFAWGILICMGRAMAQDAVFETSFEEGAGALPKDWEIKFGKLGRFEWVRGRGRTGDRCIRIIDESKTDAAGLRGPKIPVNPGERVWLRAWFYADAAQSASVYMEVWDAAGKRMSEATQSFGVRSPGGQWGSVTGRMKIPAGAVSVTPLLYSSSTALTDGYFDDVTFGKGMAPVFKRVTHPPATVRHPCGPYSEEDIARARENVRRHPWAKSLLAGFKRQADFWMRVPDAELKDWIPDLTPFRVLDCPKCGATWSYCWQDLDSGKRIKCRKCGAEFPNAEFPETKTEVLLTPTGREMPHPYYEGKDGKKFRISGRLRYGRVAKVSSLGAMGRVYALTGDVAYAQKAVKVMRRLAEVYPDYVPHDWTKIYEDYGNTQSGKLSGWKLSDCTAFLEIGLCYDLIYNSGVLTDDDKVRIENRLFRELGEFLMPIPQKGCCINDGPFQMSAAAMMGVLLGEHRFIQWAVDPPFGFRGFIRDYFFRDGHWSDGSASYEAMALSRLYMLPEILQGYSDPPSYRANDRYDRIDVLNDPLLKKVHLAPLYAMLPDRSFPPFNDSAKNVRYSPQHAEVQYFWYPSDRNKQILNWVYDGKANEQGSEYSLFRRPPDIDFASVGQMSLSVDSTVRAGAGWAYLRVPETRSALVLDYGEPCGWHGHPDRLNFILFAHDREVVTDLGYLGARHHFRPWMAHGICHNLVMVDGKDQERKPGRLICFQSGEWVQAVVAEAPDTCPGVSRYERSMLLITPAPGVQYVADVFRVAGGERHDFSFHGDGAEFRCDALTGAKPMAGELGPKEGGYDWLEKPRTVPAPADILADWRFGAQDTKASSVGVRLRMLDAAGELITARGPNLRDAKTPYEKPMLDFLIQRRAGPANTFVSVVEPVAGEPVVRSAQTLRAIGPAAAEFGAVALRVEHSEGVEYVVMAAERNSCVSVSGPAGGDLCLIGRLGVVSYDKAGAMRFAWMAEADRLTVGGERMALRATACHEGAITDFDEAKACMDVAPALPAGTELAGLHLITQNRMDGVYEIDRVEPAPAGSRVYLRDEPVMRVERGENFRVPVRALWRP